MVGVAGFEPTTPCSQSRCANRTALHPVQWLFFAIAAAKVQKEMKTGKSNVFNVYCLKLLCFYSQKLQ